MADGFEKSDYRSAELQLSMKEDTYTVVGPLCYLLGVEVSFLEKRENAAELGAYEAASSEKNARILHYLCMARTSLLRNFSRISQNIRNNGRSIYSADETIKDCINQLHKDGIELFARQTRDLNEYISESNRLINDRINNCRSLFPDWLNFDYVREFVCMPNGISNPQSAGKKFQESHSLYPYGVYCNWPVEEERGNILHNDRKFINLLYSWHADRLFDQSKVSDASEQTKDRIYYFIGHAEKIAVVVDAENSDPYRLCSTMQQLNSEYTGKIAKIIIIDDAHTTAAWDVFEKHVGVPVEHCVVDRLLEHKSNVDMTVALTVAAEFYRGGIDSFLLGASDSDYFTLMKQLPDARFLVMAEREKFSPVMKQRLTESGITYCYIDDFYSGDNDDLQRTVITSELRARLAEVRFGNLEEILRYAIEQSRARITEEEFRAMYQKLKQSVKLNITDAGDMEIQFTFRGIL